jgi:hypothetical protein
MTSRQGRSSIDPLPAFDWDFSSCPDDERLHLYHYEFSRESEAILDRVASIRFDRLPKPTYWSPRPAFGWPEWPLKPYLSIPAAERAQRRKALDAQQCTSMADLLALRARLFTPASHPTYDELASALLHLAPKTIGAGTPVVRRTGRAAGKAALSQRLQALRIYRLRERYTATQTIEILGGEYADKTTVDRVKRRFPKFLAEFVLQADTQIAAGLWFPPFGRTLVCRF